MPSNPYIKPALSSQSHVALLRQRGLVIADEASALHYLQFIGYYRLSGYARPFQTDVDHQFSPGTRFEQILDLYIFDRKLRLILLDAIERIEIAVRAAVSNTMCDILGPHWFMERSMFTVNANDHTQLLTKLQEEMGFSKPNRREQFINHYINTYDDPTFPPSWMMIETLSLGTVSRIYSDLSIQYRKEIARLFSLQHEVLASILHSMSYLRNICAHHSRLWNREFRIKPIIPKILRKTYKGSNNRLSGFVAIIEMLLSQIAPGSEWRRNFDNLLAEYPNVPRSSMGFSNALM